MGLKAVLFDAGGVLVTPPIADHQRLVPHLSKEDVRRVFHASYMQTAMSTEDVLDDFWITYSRALGLADDAFAGDYEDPAHGAVQWNVATAHAADVLGSVKSQGIAVAVVSNAGGNVARLLDEAGVCHVGSSGSGTEIDVIFDSGDSIRYPNEEVSRKPMPTMINDALAHLDVHASEVLFVGDALWSDGLAARNASVRFAHMDPFDDCAVTDFPEWNITVEPEDHVHVTSMKDVLTLLD